MSLIIMNRRKHKRHSCCCDTSSTTITIKKSCLMLLIQIIIMMILHPLPLVLLSMRTTVPTTSSTTSSTSTSTSTSMNAATGAAAAASAYIVDADNTPTITTTFSNTATITTTTTITLREFLIAHQDNDSDDMDDGIYLAMAPAFFGFYGYFGALAGIEDELFPEGSSSGNNSDDDDDDDDDNRISLLIKNNIIKGVSGASAGAMAAVLLAAGISPNVASKFVSSLELKDFEDYFGLGSLMKGDKFESIMNDFILSSSPIINNNDNNNSNAHAHADTNSTTIPEQHHQQQLKRQFHLQLEEAYIPVAISATDILPKYGVTSTSSWNPWSYYASSSILPKPKIIKEGSMSRAVRASACFPGLFQPVGWIDYTNSNNNNGHDYDNDNHNTNNLDNNNNFSLLIDGGIFDWAGYNGLKEIINANIKSTTTSTTSSAKTTNNSNGNTKIRVLNMVMGGFGTSPPGPLAMSKELFSSESQSQVHSVLSLSIINLPSCGPFSMSNGPIAINAANQVIRDIMDRPIESMPMISIVSDNDDGSSGSSHHYFLEIDASSYWNN